MKTRLLTMALFTSMLVLSSCCKLDDLDRLEGAEMWSDDVENGYYINGSKAWDIKTFVPVKHYFEDLHYKDYYMECSLFKEDYMDAEYYDNNIFPIKDYLCSFRGSKTEKRDDGNETDPGTYWEFDYVYFRSPRALTRHYYKAYKNKDDAERDGNAIISEMKIYSWDEETKIDGSMWYDVRVRILIESGDESGSVVDIVYRGKPYEHPDFGK